MLDEPTLTRLLDQAPRFRKAQLPGGLTAGELQAFERRLGFALPDDYREFLRMHNGAWVDPGIFGVRPGDELLDIESALGRFPCWRAKKWVPISADACGNYYVVSTTNEFGLAGPVLFLDQEYSSEVPQYVVASDVGHFLIFVLENELSPTGWPFDKGYVLSKDADILRAHDVNLPWNTTT